MTLGDAARDRGRGAGARQFGAMTHLEAGGQRRGEEFAISGTTGYSVKTEGDRPGRARGRRVGAVGERLWGGTG